MKNEPNVDPVIGEIMAATQRLGYTPPELLAVIPHVIRPRNYAGSMHLLNDRELSSLVWYLRKGYVRWYTNVHGHEITQYISKPGSFILSSGFYTQKHTPLLLQALPGGCETYISTLQEVKYVHDLHPATTELTIHQADLLNVEKETFLLCIGHPDIMERYRFIKSYVGMDFFSGLDIKDIAPLINIEKSTLYRWFRKQSVLKQIGNCHCFV